MGTSELGGAVAYASADLGADRFGDVLLMRDLVSTAKHKADQAAQVRACWVAPVAGLWQQDSLPHQKLQGAGVEGALDLATEADPRWFRFDPVAEFAPCIRADGSGYSIRVRIAGCAGAAGGRCDFCVVVTPTDEVLNRRDVEELNYPSKRFSNITSTTPAWLTPDDGSHILTVPRELVDFARLFGGATSTYTTIGGPEISVMYAPLRVLVFGETLDVDTLPELHGFYAAEYVGKT